MTFGQMDGREGNTSYIGTAEIWAHGSCQVRVGPGANGFQMWKWIAQDDVTFVSFNQYECIHSI
jgi:hypothetical protein